MILFSPILHPSYHPQWPQPSRGWASLPRYTLTYHLMHINIPKIIKFFFFFSLDAQTCYLDIYNKKKRNERLTKKLNCTFHRWKERNKNKNYNIKKNKQKKKEERKAEYHQCYNILTSCTHKTDHRLWPSWQQAGPSVPVRGRSPHRPPGLCICQGDKS